MNLTGGAFDFIAAFLGGVLVSFTPCVYPLVPIAVGYIGARAVDSKARGFILSLIFVSGTAVTYALLGVIAVFTGTIFGWISNLAFIRIIAGAIIVIFGLSLLDILRLPFPNIAARPLRREKGGYFSVFILGLSSGLLITPCTSPVLGSILVFLAAKQNLFYAIALLVSFAYGIGLILILAGTFSAVLVKLPRPGGWMARIKKIFSFLLIAMGGYFIYTGIKNF